LGVKNERTLDDDDDDDDDDDEADDEDDALALVSFLENQLDGEIDER
jgi:hypothetical protein